MISKVLILLSLSVFVSTDTIVDPSEAKLIIICGPDCSQSFNLTDITGILQYQTCPKIHIYIHGFNETPNSESVEVIKDAYNNTEINLWIIDWGAFVTSTGIDSIVLDYIAADFNLINLAPYLADMFIALFNSGLSKNCVTLVGHSLGGQLAGEIGRQFTQKTNGQKLFRIIGLDPAGPGFLPQELLPYIQTLGKNDAKCVEIIHTDIPMGSPPSTGDVDFYPNCGLQDQPGCQSDLCSHQRSWRFWAEIIKYTNDPKFYSFPVISCTLFLLFGIEHLKSRVVVMGTGCAVSARGPYYLKTNSEPRYAKGLNGY